MSNCAHSPDRFWLVLTKHVPAFRLTPMIDQVSFYFSADLIFMAMRRMGMVFRARAAVREVG
jgi:hypothetical protein